MNIQYKPSPRFSATGLATGSILAVIVAMAISVFLDFQPSGNSAHTAAAYSVSAHA